MTLAPAALAAPSNPAGVADGLALPRTGIVNATDTSQPYLDEDSQHAGFMAVWMMGVRAVLDETVAYVNALEDAEDAALAAHLADTTAVHGIPNTALLETQAGAQAKVDAHAVDTLAVHGVADMSLLATRNYADTAVAAHAGNSPADPHGDRAYADGLASGVRPVAGGTPVGSVDLATTDPVTLSGEQVIDGTLTSVSDVLVKDQPDQSENWIYTTGPGAWTRRSDANSVSEVAPGASVIVLGGTVNAGSRWNTQPPAAAVLDVDPIVVGLFSQPGQTGAGNGLELVGSTMNVVPGFGLISSLHLLEVDDALVQSRSERDQPFGYPSLDVNGVLSPTVLPVQGRVWIAENWGVVGDGVTDDEPAFSALVAVVAAAGGGTILVQSTLVLLGDTPVWLDKVRVKGGGEDITTLRLANGVGTAFDWSARNHVGASDLTLDCNAAGQAAGSHGVFASTVANAFLHRVRIKSTTGWGVNILDGDTVRVDDVDYESNGSGTLNDPNGVVLVDADTADIAEVVDAAVADEAALRTTADGLRQLLSQKDQTSGYMALDAERVAPDKRVRLSRVIPRLVDVREQLGILTASEGGTGTAAKIIDAIVTAGHRRLYFPGMGSVYELENTSGAVCVGVTGIDDLEIVGEGPGLTTFKAKDGVNSHSLSFTTCARLHLHDFGVDGNRLTQTGGHGIRIDDVSHSLLERLRILHAYGYALGMQTHQYLDVTVRHCYFEDSGADGSDVKNRDTMNNRGVRFENVWVKNWGARGPIQEPDSAALDCRGAVELVDCWAEGDLVLNNTIYGHRFRQSDNALGGNGPGASRSQAIGSHVYGANVGLYSDDEDTAFIGCVAEQGTHGCIIGPNANRTTLSAVRCLDGTADGFRLVSPTFLVGCVSRGNGSDGAEFKVGSDGSRVSGGTYSDNAGRGFNINAGVNGVDLGDAQHDNNTLGEILDSGSNTGPVVEIRLPIADAILPATNAPTVEAVDSTSAPVTNTPTPRHQHALFDKATDQHLMWEFELPPTWRLNGRLRLRWGAKVTTGKVAWKAGIAIRKVDDASVDTATWNAVDTVGGVSVPTTLNGFTETTIKLTMTGAGQRCKVIVFLGRDADDATNDTADGDAVLEGVTFAFLGQPTPVPASMPLSIPAIEAHWADDPGWTFPDPDAAVASWRDASGHGLDLVASGSAQPLFRVNGIGSKNAIEFDGLDDLMGLASLPTAVAQPYEIVAVLQLHATTASKTIFDSGTGFAKLRSNASSVWSFNAGTSLPSATAVDTSPHYLRMVVNGASSELWLDGTQIATGNAGANAWQGFVLGATVLGSEFSAVSVHFIAIYRGLTAQSRSDLLAWSRGYVGTP